MTTIFYVLSCLLAYPLADLGHDDFEVRDRATEKFKKDYPLSKTSLYFGLFSIDPEIKYRSNLILRQLKADDVILAKKLSNPNIKKLLNNDEYPKREECDFLKDPEVWSEFIDVMVHYKLYEPKTEVMIQENREGVYWIMWARAKCVRYGKDPKAGSGRMPDIIRPGGEPKKVRDFP